MKTYFILVPVQVSEAEDGELTAETLLHHDTLKEYRERLGTFSTKEDAVKEFWFPYHEDSLSATGN